jgi:hypothetical protein
LEESQIQGVGKRRASRKPDARGDNRVTARSATTMSFLQRIQAAMNDDDDIDIPTSSTLMELDTPSISKTRELMRHWVNERSAPEILQCQTQLLNGLLDFVADQVRILSDILCTLLSFAVRKK